jgi:hypothetical protein
MFKIQWRTKSMASGFVRTGDHSGFLQIINSFGISGDKF